jgi:hypothetical protein
MPGQYTDVTLLGQRVIEQVEHAIDCWQAGCP